MEAHRFDDPQAWIKVVVMGFHGLDDPRGWIKTILPTLVRSPLYYQFASGMADDPELIELLNLVDKAQPMLILFFTAVNFLLFAEQDHPLAQFYPSLTKRPRPAQDAFPYFRDFCLSHREDLRQMLPQAWLQTNEVTRCACLLPAFHLVHTRGGGKPLSLIEIGASAGLNLNWFRYGYTYQFLVVGHQDSPVQIHCNLHGDYAPDFPDPLPAVVRCIGIDLHPLYLDNEADGRWLEAHIWPEETWRYQLLDAAIQLARLYPPPILAGDACHLLPELLAHTSLEQTVCVFHSFALNQGPNSARQQIEQQLAHASRTRTVFQVALEIDPGKTGLPTLELRTYQAGAMASLERLAYGTLHGEHLTWLKSA
jgi:hypothetical protein